MVLAPPREADRSPTEHLGHRVGTDLILTLPRRVAAFLDSDRLAVLEPPLPLPGFAVHVVWHMDADPAHRWLRRLVS